ncbi:DUF1456 family protein [Colwellia sp. C2M11]|uniref:DUF1456 family protein n=1 Tax=unclassified Colwellia TaxID=196834 RepID=UPI001C092987|nr:DUF1456 family protein [Colwellia sp. C2M11]
MNNNDVLRRLRYTFNYNDKQMIAIFSSAGLMVTREQVSQWLKKDNDADFVSCQDVELASFLNGFINEKRGKREGAPATPEKRLTNNIVLTKLKIALNLKAEELIELLASVDFRLNKPELSAFSRRVDHQHYRECKDQVLRNLLQAIDKKHHVARTSKIENNSADKNTPLGGKSQKNKSHNSNTPNNNFKAKNQNNETWVDGARPNASAIYENPNSKTDQAKPSRKVLKLKPEDIYKQSKK